MRRALVLGVLTAALAAAPAHAQRYGALEFPRDENQHVDGWDWWWGAAHVVTRSGHRYTLGFDFDSYGGVPAASENQRSHGDQSALEGTAQTTSPTSSWAQRQYWSGVRLDFGPFAHQACCSAQAR